MPHTPMIQNAEHVELQNTRPTIGLLTRKLTYTWALRQVQGVMDACQEHQVTLICFPGGMVFYPDHLDTQHNIVYDLASAAPLDGLICMTSAVGYFPEQTDLARFYERFHPLPIVGLDRAMTGVPTVLKSDYESMCEALTHIVEAHSHRDIAIIARIGSPGPHQSRYQAYIDTLAKYGIPYNPNLVFSIYKDSDNDVSSSFIADLAERRLRPGADFSALVAVDDELALTVLRTLQARGVRVPEEVAVIGFDDLPEGWVITPPLTTVSPPFYDMGYTSVKMLLALISGESVPDRRSLPGKLVLRQSCGCLAPEVMRAAMCSEKTSRQTLAAVLKGHQKDIIAEMARAVGSEPSNAGLAERLIDEFAVAVEGRSPDSFLHGLNEILLQVGMSGGKVRAWHNGLSVLCRWLQPCFDDNAFLFAENLWQQGRVLIGTVAERMQAYKAWQAEQQAQQLRALEAALITTFDVNGLMNVLADGLPRLGFASCYLALYESPGHYQYPQPDLGWSRLMLAYNERGRFDLEPDEQRFPTGQLLPENIRADEPRNLVLESLYFQEEQIGFAMFEVDPRDIGVCEVLRGQISSALQGALLVQQVQAHENHLENLVNERTIELTQANSRLQEEIFERHRIEEAIRISEQQYRLLAENVQDGIVIVQDGATVFANTAFIVMVRQSREHLIGGDLASLFPEYARDVARNYVTHGYEAGSREPQWQVELMTGDRQTIWTEIEQARILWDNQPARLLTIRNINQRKLREIQLEQERTRLQQENLTFKATISDRYRFGLLVGKSPAMQRVYELIISAATSDVNVLVSGESGTGKELIARTLHQISPRKTQAFVPVNCASIPETLFEREFFGHRKGAFTGAERDVSGLFDRAHKGILFLDEVTELSPGTQAKLLRVLQDGEYTPLGSNTPRQADVLIVAATNKNWRTEIEQGRLRKDFFYRIGVIEIDVAPLRERKEDLPLLIDHLLERYRRKHAELHGNASQELPAEQATLPGELVQALYACQWPGNVRELENVLQRYLATRDLPSVLKLIASPGNARDFQEPVVDSAGLDLPQAMQTIEKRIIADMLAQNRYNTKATAQKLGIPRRTLAYKIKRYHLNQAD